MTETDSHAVILTYHPGRLAFAKQVAARVGDDLIGGCTVIDEATTVTIEMWEYVLRRRKEKPCT